MKKYEKHIKSIWRKIYGCSLDLDNPITFNEKMQWLKLYESTPIKTQLADKLLAKEWVKDKIGEEYIIKTIKVYDSSDEIDFNELPNQFVLKCNHGSGYNIIVKDKDSINENEIKQQLNQWMSETYGQEYGEYHYKNIKPKIFAEEYIKEIEISSLIDYKLWCFNGDIRFICAEIVDTIHGNDSLNFFDLSWNRLEYVRSEYPPVETNLQKPSILFDFIKKYQWIVKEFTFVRLDLFIIGNKIYIGEFTFTPTGGFISWDDYRTDYQLGAFLKLPLEAYDFNKNMYFKPKKNILNIIAMNIYSKKKVGNLRLFKIFGLSFKYIKVSKCKKN